MVSFLLKNYQTNFFVQAMTIKYVKFSKFIG